ncbi:hypothetical protein PLICRDRAFT_47324 [Plicaturopsis crispa FD-325 SS-3]|uniref:Uncharacterized protein n=1 Tax=Plicaturopsis crispa FD-325 SS-3 TaxID=944288 RepID=A0A0C9SK81_PLICR|nr:hypothetical protein PLICRDRAFT_47324 [Plicaturopsis crispa FD-325 SS-3]
MDLEEDDDAPVTDIWSRAAGPGLPLSVYRYNERTPGHVAPADSSETLVSSREMDDKMDDKGCWTDGEDDVGLEGDGAI